MGRWNKFVLLMWKNALLQYRRPLQTCMEILFPVVACVGLVLLRILIKPETKPERQYTPFCVVKTTAMCDDSANVSVDDEVSIKDLMNFDLVYSPNGNAAIDRSMNWFKPLFKNVRSFANKLDLEAHFATSDQRNTTFAAVVFDDELNTSTQQDLPDNTEVTIRFPGELRQSKKGDWQTNRLFPVDETQGPRMPDENFGAEPYYYKEGFLALQTLLAHFLIYGQLGASKNEDVLKIGALPIVKMQRFPHASWIEDRAQPLFIQNAGYVIILGFYYSCINTVKAITVEKENQIKETMMIMGLPNWLHWTAWFVRTFILLLISVVLAVVVLKVTFISNYSVFTHADPMVLFLFLILYVCSMITLCFLVSVFFAKATSATTAASIVIVVLYLPYMLIHSVVGYEKFGLAIKMLICLAYNSALGFGFRLMMMYEETNEGVQWSNIFKSTRPDDDFALGHVMLMLLVDTFIHLFVALYVEAVFPGEYGVPQPWNFLFTSAYWRGPAKVAVEDAAAIPANENFEKEPNLNKAVQIRGLRKEFKNKAAVRNLWLNMYQDQITVLLGHNGAGKTTTMSMLTGMFPPTSGTAIVEGHDIITDMDGVRLSLGLCPQHNILFDDLTVKEHLIFFGRLKGLGKKDVAKEAKNYIQLLKLKPKTNAKSSTLSGGMKRKLCVGIAMCGNSKVVMLDEPTAGMDPTARRAIWELIQEQKAGRAILLTTHFMDEADLLGDRIAIMAGGELQCCGSSFFLKKKYGAGYNLIMDVTPACSPLYVTQLLKQYIPSIEIHTNIGSELTYFLPEDRVSVFGGMLRDLEHRSDGLGIRGYGISLTTLEEVFMKVGADHGQEELYNDAQDQSAKRHAGKLKKWFLKKTAPKVVESRPRLSEAKLTISGSTTRFLRGCGLVRNQFSAMFMKRILAIVRSRIMFLIQLVLPIVVIIVALVTSSSGTNSADLPKLSLSLDSYSDQTTLMEHAADAAITELYDIFVGMLQNSNHNVEEVDDIPDVMLDYTKTIPATVRKRYLLGVSLRSVKHPKDGDSIAVTAWYNSDPLHAPPMALGMALSAIYELKLKKQLRFSNHPLPFTVDTKAQNVSQLNSMGSFMAICMSMGMAFYSSFFVLFYVRERVCKSKHLQYVSGVKVYVFWIASFICDFATFIMTSTGIIIVLICFQKDGFRTGDDLGRFFLILLYFGVAMLPMMYLASYLFDVPSSAMSYTMIFSLFCGTLAMVGVQFLSTPKLQHIADIMHWVFLIVPHYSLATGIRDSFTTYTGDKICTDLKKSCAEKGSGEGECRDLACQLLEFCCQTRVDYYTWQSPGIGRNLIYSFGIGTTMFLLLLMLDAKWFSWIRCALKKSTVPVANEDSDVAEEKRMIREANLEQLLNKYAIVLWEVTKYYKNFLAVNGLSLGIKKFECFGLLGVNGGGKTTTFKMLTGDVRMTRGDAWVNRFSVKSQFKKVQKNIGYCPQFDALLDDLTAKETIVMFALIRGVPRCDCSSLAEKFAQDFDFHRHLNKAVKKLSGGNKRKLSTAIALIGEPPVVYLDEPTNGMDPATKRSVWNALCRFRDQGNCIVLTSHSMEECEALCTRLAIMVNGNFKCLGSTQHLRNKFAEGYTLTIKKNSVKGHETSQIEKFIKDNFPSSVLQEKHQELLTFAITDASVPCSTMFNVLERNKKMLNIEDYSLGQSSLEQVFLTFTKQQS